MEFRKLLDPNHKSLLKVVWVVLALAIALPPAEAQQYTAAGHAWLFGPTDMNNSATVIGTDFSQPYSRSFKYSNGVVQDLGNLGGGAYATAINDSGVIVGWSGNIAPIAFIYSNGTMQALPGFVNNGSAARDINNLGTIVGYRFVGSNEQAFSYSNGTAQNLGTLGGERSWATRINLTGTIVGYSEIPDGGFTLQHAFIYKNGAMQDMGTLGGDSSYPQAINDSDTVVGYSQITGSRSRTHAFIYKNGTMLDIGTLGGGSSNANGINNEGTIVGSAEISDFTPHAFLYVNGQMADLNQLVNLPNDELVSAYAINDHGQILVSGRNQAYILTPIPGAPLITGQPVSQNANAGGSASFSVAVNGYPTPTLQWQHLPAGSGTWANVSEGNSYSGSTTSTLTVSNISTGMNGYQFRCVASNSTGSTTSDVAQLSTIVAPSDAVITITVE